MNENAMRRSEFDELDSDDSLEYVLAGEPFTGEVVETDRSGRLLSLSTVVAGQPDGLTTIWYSDGTKKLQETIKNGSPVGMAQRWHVNGVLAEEKTFDELRTTHRDRELERSRQVENRRGVVVSSRSASHAVAEARAYLVAEYGQNMKTPNGENVVVLEGRIMEYEIAWLVPFNTQKLLATGEPFDGLLPNAVVVPKNPAVAPPCSADRDRYSRISRKG